jgi:hypothetical protein
VFKIADDNGLLLLDLKDLRAILQYAGDNGSQFTTKYGNISAASVGAIQRGLLQIETRAARSSSASRCSTSTTSCRPSTAKGVINILAADQLMNSPRLYATFLLWMLSELFEQLPEVGDPKSPSWCSSSTRRTCCSTRRPRCWWSGSSWWCGWCAPRASACTS